MIPLKEKFDEEIIDSAFLKISEIESNELKTHFVYAGAFNLYRGSGRRSLRSSILERMKKNIGDGDDDGNVEMESYYK